MDLTVAKEWSAALRSGDFKQGKSYLCTDDGYCCLGVLCEIKGLKKNPPKAGERGYRFSFDAGGSSKYGLPRGFAESLGMNVRHPNSVDRSTNGDLAITFLFGKGTMAASCLAYANDHGATFEEIADYIDAHAAEL